MTKFKKSEMKKSLKEGISLVFLDQDFQWVEFHELADYYDKGYILINDEKREHYERIKR